MNPKQRQRCRLFRLISIFLSAPLSFWLKAIIKDRSNIDDVFWCIRYLSNVILRITWISAAQLKTENATLKNWYFNLISKYQIQYFRQCSQLDCSLLRESGGLERWARRWTSLVIEDEEVVSAWWRRLHHASISLPRDGATRRLANRKPFDACRPPPSTLIGTDLLDITGCDGWARCNTGRPGGRGDTAPARRDAAERQKVIKGRVRLTKRSSRRLVTSFCFSRFYVHLAGLHVRLDYDNTTDDTAIPPLHTRSYRKSTQASLGLLCPQRLSRTVSLPALVQYATCTIRAVESMTQLTDYKQTPSTELSEVSDKTVTFTDLGVQGRRKDPRSGGTSVEIGDVTWGGCLFGRRGLREEFTYVGWEAGINKTAHKICITMFWALISNVSSEKKLIYSTSYHILQSLTLYSDRLDIVLVRTGSFPLLTYFLKPCWQTT